MKRHFRFALVAAFGLLVAVPVFADEGNADEQKAIESLKKIGAKMQVDPASPGKPVVVIFLDGPQVTDAALEPIKTLAKVQKIYLSKAQVTDAGLEYLKISRNSAACTSWIRN